MEMAEGRFFSEDFITDSTSAVVVNETTASLMGKESPVGKRLSLGRNDFTVIGVIKDFNFRPVHTKIDPLVLYMRFENPNTMFVRFKGLNISQSISYIENIYKKFDPDSPFNYRFLDEEYDSLYRAEQRMEKIFGYFAFMAIAISCLGLFGLASYSAEQRTREIGIRKVLGASIPNVLGLLSREFIVLVFLSNIIAWPIAYFAMNNWLKNFAYRIDIGLLTFLFTGILSLGIAMLTVSFQTIRAAHSNPLNSLKYE